MNCLQLNQLPSELQAVVSLRDLAAGEILLTQHDLAEAIFILESGQIQLVNYTESGQQVNHYSIRAGESFAEVALFNECYVCTAIATTASRVWVLPKQAVLIALRHDPDLAVTLIEQLARRLHESKLLLELRGIRSACNRVLHYLHLNVESDGMTVRFDRPLKEIADALGLTPEALSRTLKQLHTEGRIQRFKRKVTLCKEFPKLDSSHGRSQISSINCKET